MAGWVDRWAKRAASSAPRPEAMPGDPSPAPSPQASSHSRRAFMKKAGVVGAAVWTVPVIQSAVAPAAAASATVCSGGGGTCGVLLSGPGPCPKCATGVACSTNNDCATGVGCSSRTGTTVCGGPGAACNNSGNCQYNNCTNSICGYSAGFFGSACGTPNGSFNGPPRNAACRSGSTCRVGPTGQYRCRP